MEAVVKTGAYPSVAEAIDAALVAVEFVAVPGFEGTQEGLDTLLAGGLNSGDPIEITKDSWNRLTEKTDQMVAEHKARK